MITYQTVKQFIYKVNITNVKTGKCFDHYLIKVSPEEIDGIERGIHERYPSSILKVDIKINEYETTKQQAKGNI